MFKLRKTALAALVVPALMLSSPIAQAGSIYDAMAKAYEFNPDLNAVRAGIRATDEGVAIAKSGYRPLVTASGSLTAQSIDSGRSQSDTRTASIGVSVTQMLFDGFQTRNAVRAAESNVLAAREQLRETEINILLAAAQAYTNLARDQQIVQIRRQNISFLDEQLKAARARFDVGETTRTDVSQAVAQLAQANALLTSAVAASKASAAVYAQVVGVQPTRIRQPSPLAKLLPKSAEVGVAIGLREHPSVLREQYEVDAAGFTVKQAEGALLPGVRVVGSVTEADRGVTTGRVTAELSMPLYQGGRASATVRQQKELLGQSRIQVDIARQAVQQTVITAWTQLEAARATIVANRSQLEAANLALNGVVEERNVGQRTTLDVLNAQQSVLNARESIVQSERNAVVASYQLAASMGRLTVGRLGLKVTKYRPEVHYEKVKDKWYGLRTVDGR